MSTSIMQPPPNPSQPEQDLLVEAFDAMVGPAEILARLAHRTGRHGHAAAAARAAFLLDQVHQLAERSSEESGNEA